MLFGHDRVYSIFFLLNFEFVATLLNFTSDHTVNFVLKTVTLILEVSVFHPHVRKFEILKRKCKTVLRNKSKNSFFSPCFLTGKAKSLVNK